MSLTCIDHSELYVHDKNSSVNFLTGLGFRPIVAGRSDAEDPDRHSIIMRNGSVQLKVTSPRGAGGAVAEFLDEHGEGIADVAMRCDDLEKALDRAGAAGVRTIVPAHLSADGVPMAVVEGFGAVRHTLIQRDQGANCTLPPGYSAPIAPTGTVNPPPTVRSCDHVAVCLPAGTLRDTVERYEQAFGLEYYSCAYVEVGLQAMDSIVVRSPSGGITFTMIEPDVSHEPGQIDQFLDRNNGAGVQHLAFLVDDIVGEVRRARAEGVEFLSAPEAYYHALARRIGELRDLVDDLRDTCVLADRDEWGHLLQIFTRSPHPRSALFYELIQRNGARGFGNGNIRALYEAVESQRAQLLVGH